MPDLVKELEVRVKFISDVKKLAIPDSKKSYDSLEKLNKSLIDTIKLYKDVTTKSPWAKEVLAINKATAALSRYNAELAKGKWSGGGGGRARDALGRFTPMGRAGKAASLLRGVSAAPDVSGLFSEANGTPYKWRGLSGDESRYADAATAGLGGGAFNDPFGRTSGQIGAWFAANSREGAFSFGLGETTSEKFGKQEDRIAQQRAHQAQLKQFRDAKQAREIGRIGEGASFKMGLSQYDSPAYRRETARGVMGEQGRLAQGTVGATQVAHLQTQMEAAKVMKSAQEDINRAKDTELDTEGRIVDQQQRKVELLKSQLEKTKSINDSTASAVGRATPGERRRLREIVGKLDAGEKLSGREADFVGKFGGGAVIADKRFQEIGRKESGEVVEGLARHAGADQDKAQDKYNEASKNYKESKSKYDEHMKEFEANMKKFTEDFTKTIKDINKALLTAIDKLTKQNDYNNYDIPPG